MTDPMVVVADQVRRLGEALITCDLEAEKAEHIAATIASITDSLADEPRRSKWELLGGQDRVATFLETGQWPAPPPDGSPLEFDRVSVIGGEANPFSVGASYRREAGEAVGTVTVGRCFEGPPDRVHGGIICSIFDEVMGSVFRATGTASAFTGELTVRFEAPAPLGVELEFRARLVGSEGRKRFLEGQARSADGQFASATAVFVEMRPETLLDRARG